MQRYLHTDKPELGKLSQCIILNIPTRFFVDILYREGYNDTEELRGIIPRAIDQIFDFVQANASPHRRFLVRASYLQIYNEMVGTFFSHSLCENCVFLIDIRPARVWPPGTYYS